MTSLRVTQRSIATQTLAGLQNNIGRLGEIQQRLSSGKQISKPSDSPTGTVSAMQLRSEIRANEQWSRNADDGIGWLGTMDQTLSSSLTSVQKVRALTLQGLNSGATSQQALDALAVEVGQINQTLVSLSNTTYLGRPVFGGTTGGDKAFDPNGAYVGDTGQVQRRVADGMQVRVDVPASVFGTGTDQIFGVLDSVVNGLKGDPSTLSGDLDRLDSTLRTVGTELASVGSRYSQLTSASDAAATQTLTLTSRLSDIEDVDLAKAVIDLQTQNVGYEAALAATAKVVQPSLVDFLR